MHNTRQNSMRDDARGGGRGGGTMRVAKTRVYWCERQLGWAVGNAVKKKKRGAGFIQSP